MRLLWLTNMANPQPRAGGGIRSLRLVQAASQHWPVDVVNIGRGLDTVAYCAASGARTAQEAARDDVSSQRRLAHAVRHRLPLPASREYNRRLHERVRASARAGDVIVLEHGWLLGYLPRRGRTVVVLHNVDSELTRQLPAQGLRRLEQRWNVAAYQRLERRVTRSPSVTATVVSQREADIVGGRAHVIPNGADVPDQVEPVPAQGSILFVGSMGYPPNVEAVRWWAEQVWPASGLPPLTVVGQSADRVLSEWAGHPGVRVVGEVDDVGAWLRRARVVAVPLTAGSGTRLKILEAWAHGRPVVSTAKGAEGTGALHATTALIADDPAEFGSAVRRLLQDDVLAAALAREARAAVTAVSWDAVGERFVDVLRQAVAAR
jgi:glycosyltransferase involved in cell wall biosynthesis